MKKELYLGLDVHKDCIMTAVAPATADKLRKGARGKCARAGPSVTLHEQKAKGKTHPTAVRALAYKWIRILFRCWQERTAYDEIRYIKSLQRSGSPLLPCLAQPATNNP